MSTSHPQPTTEHPFTLARTGFAPLQFTGAKLAEFRSRHSSLPDDQRKSRQWFTLAIYRTRGGRYVAHASYRAGHVLGTETPVDQAWSADGLVELFDLLDQVNTADEFSNGWPSRPEMAENDRRVHRFCLLAWDEVMEECEKFVLGEAEPEVID